MIYQVKTDQVASRVFEGEAVLIHYGSSDYYSLNHSATFIWESLNEQPGTAEEIAKTLASHFQTDGETTLEQVEEFMRQLKEADLVSEIDGSNDESNSSALSSGSTAETYAPPELTKCGHLETLILSGE
ncbi:MAG: HPr-rel-A system PqqD family peptide chaperone [Verrucomicrobiota bacterium]